MLSAVPPERLVRASKGRRRASARGPDAFDRIAGPKPPFDLVFAFQEAGVRFVPRRFRRLVIGVGFLAHTLVIGFGDQKYSQRANFFSPHGSARSEIGCNALHRGAIEGNHTRAVAILRTSRRLGGTESQAVADSREQVS